MSIELNSKQNANAEIKTIPDKMTVFQECIQRFNILPINPKKCRQLISKLLMMIYTGENFQTQEYTTMFFSTSKLFQHKNQSLRQIVYLAIKELSNYSENILIVTSSIIKDIQEGESVYKPNAIRSLVSVLSSESFFTLERFFKNAIIDKNPIVSSAALVSCYNLEPSSRSFVKRFANETFETLSSQKSFPKNQFTINEYYERSDVKYPETSYMFQYHSLGLLYLLKNSDKISLIKMINTLHDGSVLKSPVSIMQLIAFIYKIIVDENSMFNQFSPILEKFLNNDSEIILVQTCKALLNFLELLSNDQFMKLISTLEHLLNLSSPTTRFAAMRIIYKISLTHPEKIYILNSELENLIDDKNRYTSTLAIITLLKTMTLVSDNISIEYSENIDRLIVKMTNLMDEISDDFKIFIIETIKNLTLKFLSKHKKLISFLTNLLREESSFTLKKSIIDALFDFVKFLPDSNSVKSILINLCDFIEDCEFSNLSVRILHLLGEQGPLTSKPSYFIRHICNRLVLENSMIRAASVSSLAKFAFNLDVEKRKDIKVLLNRCLNDFDDEVRDRTAIYIRLINLNKKDLVLFDYKYDLDMLENRVKEYLSNENFDSELDIKDVKLLTNKEYNAIEIKNKSKKTISQNSGFDELDLNDKKSKDPVSSKVDVSQSKKKYLEQLMSHPEFKNYGDLSKSSNETQYLTDKENEFVINVIKHIFITTKKLVLQFNILNCLSNTTLKNVSIVSHPDNPHYVEDFAIPIKTLNPDESGSIYVSFSIPDIEVNDVVAAFGNTLTYELCDSDDDKNQINYPDSWIEEYSIDDLEVLASDFIFPLYSQSFASVFDTLENSLSSVISYSNMDSLSKVISHIIKNLNMFPVDGSDIVSPASPSHSLMLLGNDLWGQKIGALIKLAYDGIKVYAKIEVKSSSENKSNMVLSSTA